MGSNIETLSGHVAEEAIRYKIKTAKEKAEDSLRSDAVDAQVVRILELGGNHRGGAAPKKTPGIPMVLPRGGFIVGITRIYRRMALYAWFRGLIAFLRRVKRTLEKVPLFKKIIRSMLKPFGRV